MSTLPASTVSTVDAAAVHGAPLDGTQAFVSSVSNRGLLGPTLIQSKKDLDALERSGSGITLYDSIDAALREGVSRVWFSRLTGPAPVLATANIAGSTGTSLIATAKEYGAWANGPTGLSVQVTTGPVLVVLRNGVVVESSPVLATRTDAVNWQSKYVTVTLGVDTTLPIVAAAVNLAGGTDDNASITGANLTAALARFTADYGHGQVFTPGRNTLAAQTALLQHCHDFGRTALVELAPGLITSDALSALASLRALGTGADGLPRFGGAWAQYATGPGVLAGTTRSVPWTAVEAGLIAVRERAEGHANVEPIVTFGQPRWATGVDVYYDAATAQTLYTGGLNVVGQWNAAPYAWTFHSLDDDTSQWVELAHTRLSNAVRDIAFSIGRSMDGRTIDGENHLLNEFGGKLRDAINPLWSIGALYGATPDEAYSVDVGPAQNTTTTIAAREVHADIGLKMSPHAEQVFITLARVPLGQEV